MGAGASLFDGLDSAPKSSLRLVETPPMPMGEKLSWEKELLGLYISGHPLDQFDGAVKLAKNTIAGLLEKGSKNKQLLVAHIDTIKTIITKSNTRMAFVTLHDKSGVAEGVIFPESFKKIGALLKEGIIVAVQCSVGNRDERKSLLIDNIKVLG